MDSKALREKRNSFLDKLENKLSMIKTHPSTNIDYTYSVAPKKESPERESRPSTNISESLEPNISKSFQTELDSLNLKVSLKDYQLLALKLIYKENTSIIIHETGLGKTLVALISSLLFLRLNPEYKIIVISPASLLGNFNKEATKYKITMQEDKYEFYSFKAFKGVDTKNTMLIIDEVHNIRNPNTKTFKHVYSSCKQAVKVVLLTATPFVNSTYDFKTICDILTRTNNRLVIKTRTGSHTYHQNLNRISNILQNKVSYEDDKLNSNFPDIHEHNVTITCSDEYYTKYIKALLVTKVFGNDPESFYHGYRRIVNDLGLDEYYSMKVNNILSLTGKEQTLIFSNWLGFGIELVSRVLTDNNITHDVITGMVNKKERLDIVSSFNSKSIQVLIISRAGYEGLDLKGTRNIIILDPPWNDMGLKQVIGRGSRVASHAHLPLEERCINVYHLIMTLPQDKVKIRDDVINNLIESEIQYNVEASCDSSGDEILYRIIANKVLIQKDVTRMLTLIEFNKVNKLCNKCNNRAVAITKPCNHYFCKKCSGVYSSSDKCIKCNRKFDQVVYKT